MTVQGLGIRLRQAPSGPPQFTRFFESGPTDLITTDGVATLAVTLGAESLPLPRNAVFAVSVEALSTRRDDRTLVAQSTRLALFTTDDLGALVLQGADAEVQFDPNVSGIGSPAVTFGTTDDNIEVFVTGDGTPNDVKWTVFVTTDLMTSALPV